MAAFSLLGVSSRACYVNRYKNPTKFPGNA
jgi:hypothetical protein